MGSVGDDATTPRQMTAIACWVGVDARGPASAYIATDSRLSWVRNVTHQDRWDGGRKAFSSSATPDVFGYSGEALFPSILLSQFVSALDAGIYASLSFRARFGELEALARIMFEDFPASYRTPFEFIHCGRDAEGMQSTFGFGVLSWSAQTDWKRKVLPAPITSSQLILSKGSGTRGIANALARWEASDAAGTSRAIFSAFVESLLEGDDPHTGGPPQLVGLYRVRAGRSFGVVIKRKRFLCGLPVRSRQVPAHLEWRNELFERCDGVTGRRLVGAHRHVPS